MQREENLARVEKRAGPWDLIVIGGGATGVGCAVDAASRGLDVLLLEQSDFGKGTSSRSTKLVHGGIRYLAQGNLPLVREALKERGILLRNAPHIVRKTGFVVPCYSLWQKFFYGAGLKIYDLLSGKYRLGKTKILSRDETLERLPNANPQGLRGGVLYFDGQFDDTRLLIDLVKTACEQGAVVLNYARVTSFIKDEGARVNGVVFEDALTGTETRGAGRGGDQCYRSVLRPVKKNVRTARGGDRDLEPGRPSGFRPLVPAGRRRADDPENRRRAGTFRDPLA